MTDQPRKVLFITVDQWRGECLSVLGHPVVRTPHLDTLARDGTLFRRHYASCSPCGPSRASLLTGMYLMNHRSGRNGTPLDQRHTNLAWEVRRLGFDPTLFGYTDTSPDPRSRPEGDPALTTFEGAMPGFTIGLQMPDHMTPWIADLKAKGYDLPRGRADVYRPRPGFNRPADRGHSFVPPVFTAADSETTFMTDRFLTWLSTRADENWFAHLVYLRPHPPVVAPEPYNAYYDPASVALARRRPTPEQESTQHPFLKVKIDALTPKGTRAARETLRQMRATYYAMMSQVDDQIGRLIGHLRQTGEYANTLIVLTSDHGEMGGDHYTWGKETYFEQCFYVPLIVRDPRHAADRARGAMVDEFTEAVDIMPTILDWLGADVPKQCDGFSLMPFVEGNAPRDWRQECHYELDFRYSPYVPDFDPETALDLSPDECYFSVIRDRRYKYVHFVSLPPLLFDLQEDPDEMRNLAGDPAHQAAMLDLLRRMLSWKMRFADRTLANLHLAPAGVIDGTKRRVAQVRASVD